MNLDADVRRGVGYLLSSAFFFSLMSLLVKLAGERLPSSTMVFARAFVTCVLSFLWLRHAGLSPLGNARRLLLLRGVLGFVALMLFYFAITKLPLAEVTVLHYLNPLFTVVFARVFLRERAPRATLWAMLLAFAGAVFITRPQLVFGGAASLATEGVLAAIGGAMAAGAAYTTVRKLGSLEHPLVVVFTASLVALPASLPFLLAQFVLPEGKEWLWLLLIGCTTQISQVQLTKGLALVPAGPGTAVGYVQVVFASLLGFVVLGVHPGPHVLVGTLLILLGTWLITSPRQWWPRRGH